ncbi:hypothetical protein NDU88_004294 [Pleurodeles waltl]|uniref:Uncharacterized protein n=1 Tax=Pleurodeles waltl TaxID=8319 RepID=A0AAV7QHE4_PLEWA|nr:hypothetical protein NDU88_004294 [Pleurodeles waltl]
MLDALSFRWLHSWIAGPPFALPLSDVCVDSQLLTTSLSDRWAPSLPSRTADGLVNSHIWLGSLLGLRGALSEVWNALSDVVGHGLGVLVPSCGICSSRCRLVRSRTSERLPVPSHFHPHLLPCRVSRRRVPEYLSVSPALPPPLTGNHRADDYQLPSGHRDFGVCATYRLAGIEVKKDAGNEEKPQKSKL